MGYGGLRRIKLITVAFALGAWLSACDQKETKTHVDVGSACITPVSADPLFFGDCEAHELSSDGELRIDVNFGLCLSSSCDQLLRAGCDVTREGTVITVTATAAVESEGDTCTDDCGSVTTSCTLGKLPEGSYELRYGDAKIEFDVPSTTSAAQVR